MEFDRSSVAAVYAMEPSIDEKIPSFGELFRSVSYEEIGHRAMAARAVAGVVSGDARFLSAR